MPDRPSPDIVVARLAVRRHGLVTRAEALKAGLTTDQMRQRVRSGRWQRLSPGVFRIAGAPPSIEQAALGAILAAGSGAVASHLTALGLVGVGDAPTTPHLTVAPSANARSPLAVVHRSDVPPIDCTTVGAIPCTTPARSLVDVAASLTADRIAELVDDVLCAGLAQPASVLGAMRRSQRAPGRKGVPVLLAALRPWLGDIHPDSPAEMRLLRRLEAWGFATPVRQHRVTDAQGRVVAALDLAWPAWCVGLEYDGSRTHTPRDVAHDVTREERVRALGWRIERADRFDLLPSSTRLRDLLAPVLQPSAA